MLPSTGGGGGPRAKVVFDCIKGWVQREEKYGAVSDWGMGMDAACANKMAAGGQIKRKQKRVGGSKVAPKGQSKVGKCVFANAMLLALGAGCACPIA